MNALQCRGKQKINLKNEDVLLLGQMIFNRVDSDVSNAG